MSKPLREQAADLPTDPGVYLFRDAAGQVLYVGKANNLRARVKQYFGGHDDRLMVPFLVRKICSIDVQIVSTEKEALLLENTLIKEHRPRYNVMMRDDKNFLHLRLDTSQPWPRYTLVRHIAQDGSRTFGPFHSASRARTTLAFLQRAFPLRTCSDQVLKTRSRACLLHQMHRCVAPCVDLCSTEEYEAILHESVLFLEGRHPELMETLQTKMIQQAETEDFEAAARTRDLIRDIQSTTERQRVVDGVTRDRDVWGLYREGHHVAVIVLPVRGGRMRESESQTFDAIPIDDAELLSAMLNQRYDGTDQIPTEILLPVPLPDVDALAEVLSERAGRRVYLRSPARGEKRRLLDLAIRNARDRFHRQTDESDRITDALTHLAELCRLPAPPHRIECFDNSNIGGRNPVASMAVFIDGRPQRSEFRRYKIKTVVGSDDYASMREILGRRFRRAATDGVFPDLVVVDGGKGQLGVVKAVLEDLGFDDQAVIGLAKPRTERAKGERHAVDKIVLPFAKDPIRLKKNHPSLHLLQNIRDHAHDHAIQYHRKRRRKATLSSVLEEIPGVGPTRRRALLRALGSARAVAEASVADIAAVPGIGPTTAQHIWSALHPDSD